jgi:hypothetical protein
MNKWAPNIDTSMSALKKILEGVGACVWRSKLVNMRSMIKILGLNGTTPHKEIGAL